MDPAKLKLIRSKLAEWRHHNGEPSDPKLDAISDLLEEIISHKAERTLVNGLATVQVISDRKTIRACDSPSEKAFLRVKFQDGRIVDMTLNLAEMLGGAGHGAAMRFGYEK